MKGSPFAVTNLNYLLLNIASPCCLPTAPCQAWSTQHWVCLRTLHGRHEDTTWPACLALSPDGSLLVSGSTGPFGASTIKASWGRGRQGAQDGVGWEPASRDLHPGTCIRLAGARCPAAPAPPSTCHPDPTRTLLRWSYLRRCSRPPAVAGGTRATAWPLWRSWATTTRGASPPCSSLQMPARCTAALAMAPWPPGACGGASQRQPVPGPPPPAACGAASCDAPGCYMWRSYKMCLTGLAKLQTIVYCRC